MINKLQLETYTTEKNVNDGNYGILSKKNLKDLTDYPVPHFVTEIGKEIFDGSGRLRSINLPDSATKIGESAFDGGISSQSFNLLDSVTEIGNHAFDGCHNLQNINLPNAEANNGEKTFIGCRQMRSINLPDAVTNNGENTTEGVNLQSMKVSNNENYNVKQFSLNDIDQEIDRLKRLREPLTR